MQYDLNQLGDPTQFQRLVNALLTARFGEDVRLTPLRGADNASDGETAPSNPYMELHYTPPAASSRTSLVVPPRPGRYLFQAKYHSTAEHRLSDLRALVVREFKEELQEAVLLREDRQDVNYFFVVTNLSASKDAIAKLDDLRRRLLSGKRRLHADVWWRESITSFLDRSPDLWLAFPQLFPGGVAPLLAHALNHSSEGLSRTFRLDMTAQYKRDRVVKFRQVDLEQQLFHLFVDLDVDIFVDRADPLGPSSRRPDHIFHSREVDAASPFRTTRPYRGSNTALELLVDDELRIPRILLEGGPGQGKSTITQMAAQIYRQRLLPSSADDISRTADWNSLSKARLPLRLVLRDFAEWLAGTADGTLEQYIARVIGRDSGGASVAVQDVHAFLERSSVILLLDGLDEIGSDSLRDKVLDTVMDAVTRFEEGLRVDLRVVLTTRPPALAGRRQKLRGFTRIVLAPMNTRRIDEYLARWLSVQIDAENERLRIKTSFEGRRHDPHVEALARNPMQLSVLLQFIYLKGEAFPDRRAELYREYFQIVIDRDVEKSPELRENRDLVEGLHSFLGFHLHGATEIDQGRRAWTRKEVISFSDRWLREEGHQKGGAGRFFALGEERFGLIVAVSGEGDDTTYGFEVQPIQEYFAASYISNRLPNGTAHEVFELLVHRNYWREVALFLAGLRRPNEKADLVVRAKEADSQESRGWQQNGRSIVLQLLREGVLQQPGHVLREAMDFVVDLLDIEHLRVQRTPDGLVETVARLGPLYPTNGLCKRIARIADSYEDSDDQSALAAIHRVAARLLPRKEYTKLVWGYRGNHAEAQSLVRMTCPYESPETLEDLARRQDYWAGVPVRLWARQFWRGALQHGVVVDVKYPEGLHAGLVGEFVADRFVGRGSDTAVIDIRAATTPAVWLLQQNIEAMRYEFTVRAGGDKDRRGARVGKQGDAENDVSYEYLPEDVKECLRDLIGASTSLLGALAEGTEQAIGRKIDEYMASISAHLGDAGMAGWVACRCAVEILQRLGWEARTANQELVDSIVEGLKELYVLERGRLPYNYMFQRMLVGVPSKIRWIRGGRPVALDRILVLRLTRRLSPAEQEACGWAADLPLPARTVKGLVEACRDELPKVLRFLGDRRIVGFPYGARLRVQDTQRILKICRRSEEPEILRGAATVLVVATFAGVAEPEVIVRLLAAAPFSQLCNWTFGTTREGPGEGDTGRRDKEWRLSRAVAGLVLREPERYPFRIVSRAAAFVAEIEASESTPLFEERPELASVMPSDS